MVTDRILVPFDISKYSLDAANQAIELAEAFGASITFIHIVESEPYSDLVYDSQTADRRVEEEIRESANKWFSQVAEICTKKKVTNKMEILFERGSVTETIAEYAKNMDADLIVIGHSSVHGFGRRLKGDVAKGVIDHAHAPCSVLVVKRQ
jgi:nucleotide-binding universal stress UspA family protein